MNIDHKGDVLSYKYYASKYCKMVKHLITRTVVYQHTLQAGVSVLVYYWEYEIPG